MVLKLGLHQRLVGGVVPLPKITHKAAEDSYDRL